MPRLSYETDSELEREFELELDEDVGGSEREIEEQLEAEEPREDSEAPSRSESDFAERFHELSSRAYESEADVDDAVNRVLGEMEREFFFKGLVNKVKSAGKKLLAKGIRQLGSQLGANFPAIQAITQLARGNLKGALAPLAKTALQAGIGAIPGGAAALPVLKSLGFEADDPEGQREAWQRYVSLAREAYDELAANLNTEADDPVEASRIASAAFRTALSRVGGASRGRNGPATRRIQVRRGERIVIDIL